MGKKHSHGRVSCGVPQRPVEFRSQLAAGYEERQEQRLKDAPEIMGKSYPLVNIQKNH